MHANTCTLPQYIGREVLNKYREEIEGERKKSFKLDSKGTYNTQYEKQLKQIKVDRFKHGVSILLCL